jgi:peptide/nickel transport system permease protein
MRYILRRLAFYLVTLWIAITMNFALPRLMPGDPASAMFAKFQGHVDLQQMAAMKAALGFTRQNLIGQYFTYLWNIFHLNFGVSYAHYPAPVIDVIRNELPWSLALLGTATIISFSLGTALGMFSAWRRGSVFDSTIPAVTLFLSAFPYFWIAMLLIYFLAFKEPWFPPSRLYDTLSLTWPVIWTIIYHSILPAVTIVLASVGGWIISMRNVMVSTLAEDYVTMAQAKGLSDRRIMFMYAARNAILPSITGLAMSLGFVVGGAVLVETAFSYPGVGYELWVAATSEDFPMLQALLLFIVSAVLIANFIADIVYVRLDPRVRPHR